MSRENTRPNPQQTWAEFDHEKEVWLSFTGVAYVLSVPSDYHFYDGHIHTVLNPFQVSKYTKQREGVEPEVVDAMLDTPVGKQIAQYVHKKAEGK